MKNFKVLSLVLAALMIFSMVSFVGCQNNNDNGGYTGPKVVNYYLPGEPQTLDSQKLTGNPDMVMANMFIEGLVRRGKEEGEIIPGVAKEWTHDKESNSWTFVLRDDAKWVDGTPVTTDDFLFAWKLALDTSPVYLYLLTNFIKGAEEYADLTPESYLAEVDGDFKTLTDSLKDEDNEDKKKEIQTQIDGRIDAMTDSEKEDFNGRKAALWNDVGIKADNQNITISLKIPAPFYPGVVAMPIYNPVNEAFYQKHTEAENYCLEADGLNSNGPWKVDEWKHRDYFKLSRNENYWNNDNIHLDEIHMKNVTDVETRTNLLKTGELDGSAIQAKDLLDFQDVATIEQYGLTELESKSDLVVFYIRFNHVNSPYTQNVNIRKALAYAMDRQSFVEKINYGDNPALGFIPLYFPGLEKTFREETQKELFEDNQKEKAKEYLATALQELGLQELPPLDMMTGDSDIAQKIAVKFQADWAEIGITVNLTPVPWGEQLTRLEKGEFTMAMAGWGPDFADPTTYLKCFMRDNGSNYGKYYGPEFEELMNNAKVEEDAKQRMEYLYEAERVLIQDDMAMAPMYFRMRHNTTKEYLTGVVNRGIGGSLDFYWADIDMAAKMEDKQ